MSDWRILSHGRKIFTADERFQLVQDKHPDPMEIVDPKENAKRTKSSQNTFFNNLNNNR